MAYLKWTNGDIVKMAINLISNFDRMISMDRLSLVVILAATFMLTTSSFVTNDAFANHMSDEMKWQLVYLTHNSVCSNYDVQKTRMYSEISSSYLEEYQLENSQYDVLCVNQYEYSDYQAPSDLDMIILVYDKDIGRDELNSLKIGGYYHHTGPDNKQNHAIVICDCPTFDYSSPVWILSHELSHFVLTYVGYDIEIIEDLVHENDAAYDQCIQSHTSCSGSVLKIRTESTAYSYSVMPLYEPAIGLDSQEITEEEVPVQVLELSKLITKWWTQEKISEADLSNALGFMASGKSLYNYMNPDIITADSSYDVDDEFVKNLLAADLEKENPEILSRIPENLLTNDDLISGEGNSKGMPDWFKTTIQWWVDGEITDDEFKTSVDFLRDEGVLRLR